MEFKKKETVEYEYDSLPITVYGKQYDAERTRFLEVYGLKVVRIPNGEVGRNFRGVCEYIDGLVRQSLSRHDN